MSTANLWLIMVGFTFLVGSVVIPAVIREIMK